MKGVRIATLLVALFALSAFTVARDPGGRIHRSRAAVHRFEAATGHAGGWRGHVVDHIVPLACGGPDDPVNMQWQTVAAARVKDRVERTARALKAERARLRMRMAEAHWTGARR